ncbi:DMT family transporter [Actinoplanes friuliensis]|jgi:small multidrug resistance pump|uniref:Small multidrug resistance protein n=1 Tax=Actinoplanes friuliensis DSM 7358 TaxID=1246995 RepID=U5W3W6_9ACTN|nr:multidrug efflux SMR transporter [Actinoplanes friuliensis]AGZ42601.1 small multidrug resistance protein [Actinoplanes friuliensis DSM 7358]
MAYVFLVLAIGSEVFGTSMLKATDGFSRLWPTVACLGGYVLSFVLLSQAVKHIPIGVAYAMWSGLGTAAIVAIGTVFLGESLNLVKVIGLGLIVGGVVVLNLGGAH